MRPVLVAAAIAGTAAIVPLVLVALLRAQLSEFEGLEVLVAVLFLIPVVLVIFVGGSLISGLAGGLATRRMNAATGSVLGVLAVNIGFVALRADATPPSDDAWLSVAIMGVLVLAGHLTGVAVRPRLRTT